ncbi:MAG: hypothetical protein WCH98_01445 [Verrucomicrobiota bacterium]
MPKIAIIGAGSAVFSKNIIAGVLWHPALREAEWKRWFALGRDENLIEAHVADLPAGFRFQGTCHLPTT